MTQREVNMQKRLHLQRKALNHPWSHKEIGGRIKYD